MTTAETHLVNGVVTDSITVNDRGLRYGDGCFETMAIHNGRIPMWQRHMTRLFDSCHRLAFHCQFNADDLAREADSLIRNREQGILRLTVTRGSGGKGYASDPSDTANRIMSLLSARLYTKDYSEKGIDVCLCKTRLSENTALAGMKHLNRLEQVLARNEWTDEYAEGLLCDQRGNVIEGTITNLFLVHNGEVITPKLNRCGVAGVMRAELLDRMHSRGLSVKEMDIGIDLLRAGQEGFLSNAVVGIWPIATIDGKAFSIGATTRMLQQELETIFSVN